MLGVCKTAVTHTAPASGDSTGFSKEHVFQQWGGSRVSLCCHLPLLCPHQKDLFQRECELGNQLPAPWKKAMVFLVFTCIWFVLLWQNWDGMDGISSLPMGSSVLWLGDERSMNFPSKSQEKCQRELGPSCKD